MMIDFSCVWSHRIYIYLWSVLFYGVWPYYYLQNGKPAECEQDIWKWNCPNERPANPTEQWRLLRLEQWRLLWLVVNQVLSKLCETLFSFFFTMCCGNQWLSKQLATSIFHVTDSLCPNKLSFVFNIVVVPLDLWLYNSSLEHMILIIY